MIYDGFETNQGISFNHVGKIIHLNNFFFSVMWFFI